MGRAKGKGGSVSGAGVVGGYAADRESGADLATGLTVDREFSKSIDAASKALYGRTLSNAELASLAGAPDGANVHIGGRPGLNSIEVTWYKGSANAVRVLSERGIYNSAFFNDANMGKGLGLKVLSRQIATARAFGVKELRTSASRGATLIGYKIWPKFGYDGKIPDSVRPNLPKQFRSMTHVQQLYKTQAGRDAWATHGTTTPMTLDLRSGSAGMKRFNAYKASKAKNRT